VLNGGSPDTVVQATGAHDGACTAAVANLEMGVVVEVKREWLSGLARQRRARQLGWACPNTTVWAGCVVPTVAANGARAVAGEAGPCEEWQR
jgi:hypothetical protein